MSAVDPRTPLLVGVGTASADAPAAQLMTEALTRAAGDAGAPSLLGRLDRIAVPQGTWADSDPARQVARAVGSPGAVTWRGALGVSQQSLVTEALAAIAAGHGAVVAVVGGEDRARQRRLARAGTPEPGVDTGPPDRVLDRDPDFLDPAELAAGLRLPVAQYAMIELALAAAEGTEPDEHRAEVAGLWARYNAVARTNPLAAFGQPMTAEQIATPGPHNRLLAHPYNKWHASQWNVDQAGALLLCSAGAATEYGVPRDRWVFPRVGLDAGAPVSLSRRAGLHRWPAMGLLGRAAADHLGRPLAEIELAEVYSCFPVAVRVQQRELGLPTDGTPTVTGGMAFAGGPLNNFVYQSTAAIIGQLRARPGALALVTTVCGLLTKPGLAVWATEPDHRPPLLGDRGPAARAATPTVEVVADHHGPATVASFTVTPATAEGPARTLVIADTADGRRCVAAAEDPEVAQAALAEGLIGQVVRVDGATFGP